MAACVRASINFPRSATSEEGNRLELLEIFQRFSILLRPIQRGSEQKVRVVKEVRLGIGAQESSQECDGLFGCPASINRFA